MAAGDLVVADYQVELRTTLMGATTNYTIDYNRGAIDGLVDVVTKQVESDYSHQDGVFVGEAHNAARTATIALIVTGSTPTATGDNLETMRAVWAPSSSDLPLYFRIPGFGKQYVNGRPLGLAATMRDLPFKHVPILASFRITDPTIYT